MALFKKFMSRDESSRDETRDIVRNLNHILNTKKGYGSVMQDYGIRDMNEFNDRDGMAGVIIEEVIRSVGRYEPRVEIVQVEKEQGTDLFELSFKIQCVIRESRQTMNMVFDTVGNRFKVEKD